MADVTKQRVTIEGRAISLSNLDKVLYPGRRYTKANVIDYYVRVAPFLLPHLKNRPVTLKRFPDGVYGEFFYEKDAPSFTPPWVKTFPVPRKNKAEPEIRYILINDLPTLVWSANLANLEIHPFLHRVPKLDRPTAMVFDCDPGEGANVLTCARVALMLRDVLRELGLESFAKVSGSKGLQVYVPFNSAVTYEVTQPLAKALAELLEERHPKLIVSKMPKVFRAKKVFIDWSQNAEFKTTVGVYSLRAKVHRPYVSMPVEWAELNTALKKNKKELLYFKPEGVLKRLETLGDLFAPILSLVQKPPESILRYLSKDGASTKSATAAALESYRRKRNFSKTSEPPPSLARSSKQGSRRRFVVQKHAASQLHYDFRLEMHNVLKSWSVPKGPSFKEGEKRLAMPTEDHPIEYLDFEGIIPKGQYGGGTVMVWDIGTYELIEGNYYKGYLRFYLTGSKLKGEWELRRFINAKDERDSRDKWQLIKVDRSTRAISRKRDDESALSKRTMEQIAEAADARWESNRK
jgi:bifunctional non-homologous end joining protein LigD